VANVIRLGAIVDAPHACRSDAASLTHDCRLTTMASSGKKGQARN
jgi:hypothetical protein